MRPGRSIVLADPLTGGHHAGYAAALTTGLQAAGYTVHLAGPTSFLEHVAPLARADTVSAVPYRHGKGAAAEFRKARFVGGVFETAKARRADIVHFLYLDRFVLALALSRSRSAEIPIVGTLHWSYLSARTPQRLANVPARIVERAALRWLLGRGLRVMTHSDGMAASLTEEFSSKRFHAVPYPSPERPSPSIDRATARRRLDLHDSARIMLAFGATRFEKGADLAVAALAHLPDDVHLLVAGRGTDFSQAALEELADELGTTDRLHVRSEFIQDSDVAAYFAASDVVLTPYRPSFSGQSGPVTIAAAMGIPVVSTNVPVLRETVEKYRLGQAHAAADPRAIAGSVASVLAADTRPDTDAFIEDHGTASFLRAVQACYDATIADHGATL